MIINKLKAFVKHTDIEIVSVDGKEVEYLLPYDISVKVMHLEGSTDEEMISSFISHINSRIDGMIDHLQDCKLRDPANVGKHTTHQVFCG